VSKITSNKTCKLLAINHHFIKKSYSVFLFLEKIEMLKLERDFFMGHMLLS
jgi:hypothetical protein